MTTGVPGLNRYDSSQAHRLRSYPHACTLLRVKRRELERRLLELGWMFLREGGNHRIYSKRSQRPLPVPRHNEINEQTARAILREAEKEEKS